MNNKFLLTMMMALIMLSLVSASQSSLGTFKQGDCVPIIQLCGTCTYSNLTHVIINTNDNSTLLTIYNVGMEKNGALFNYTFCDTRNLGEYNVGGVADLDGVDDAWAYDFDINLMGEELTEAKSNIYIIMLVITMLFLALTVWGAFVIPFSNPRDDQGYLLNINDLKYFKVIMWILAYLELIFLSFLMKNLAAGYLANGGFYELFNIIFNLLLILLFPAMILTVFFTIVIWLNDKKLADKLTRGFEV